MPAAPGANEPTVRPRAITGPTSRCWGPSSLAGPLASLHVEGPTDGELFRLFVTEVLVPVLWPGAVVVWDNLSIHKAAGVREALEAAGARLVYLPPYSPDLNPILVGLEQAQKPAAQGGRTHHQGLT